MAKIVEKNSQMRLGEYVPTFESKDKAFQEDAHGNFRIMIKGGFSEWKRYNEIAILKIGDQIYMGVTDFYHGDLPKGLALRVEVVDEEGDANFYKFKIKDLVEDNILESDEIEDILFESLFEGGEYTFNIKRSKTKDFIKISIIEHNDYLLHDHIMTKEEVEDYLRKALPSEDYDVITEDGEKINAIKYEINNTKLV